MEKDFFPPDIETASDAYAKRFDGKVGNWLLKVQREAVLKMLGSWPGASILEVGGGHGQLTQSLVQSGYRVTVMGSTTCCQNRIRNLLEEGRCEFREGDLFHLPFGNRSFDVVIAFHILSHSPDVDQLASEWTRVARRAVIFDFASRRSINLFSSLLFGLKRGIEGNTRRFMTYWEGAVAEPFLRAGYEIHSRYVKFLFPMVLHRVMKNPGISGFLENVSRKCGMSSFLGSPVILCFKPKDRETG